MKILHFAIEDYARIPSTLVQEERALGHESYLTVLHNTFKQYGGADYLLNLPFVGGNFLQKLKRFQGSTTRTIDNNRRSQKPIFNPQGAARLFFIMRDQLWQPQVEAFLKKIDITSFDVLVLDGGAGFLRNSRIIKHLKNQGIKIICAYYGSDLRTRGAIPTVENVAETCFTFEYDHTLLDPELTFLYYPFRSARFKAAPLKDDVVRIGHAPTNRAAKGSDVILAKLKEMQKRLPIEIVLIENMPFEQAMQAKAGCDIFIDQIGALGYGMNGLEAMAMGIPAAVQLMPDFETFLGDHPFINISNNTLEEKLTPFIQSAKLRQYLGQKGKKWTADHHNPERIAVQILSMLSG